MSNLYRKCCNIAHAIECDQKRRIMDEILRGVTRTSPVRKTDFIVVSRTSKLYRKKGNIAHAIKCDQNLRTTDEILSDVIRTPLVCKTDFTVESEMSKLPRNDYNIAWVLVQVEVPRSPIHTLRCVVGRPAPQNSPKWGNTPAFKEAIGDLDKLAQDSYSHARLQLQSLQDNLTLWNYDIQILKFSKLPLYYPNVVYIEICRLIENEKYILDTYGGLFHVFYNLLGLSRATYILFVPYECSSITNHKITFDHCKETNSNEVRTSFEVYLSFILRASMRMKEFMANPLVQMDHINVKESCLEDDDDACNWWAIHLKEFIAKP
ncbi:hypothetical protein IEQ34_015464 [Dendrobium chrysotoxum]|uniref:Uncharacterized protein n=1 Tax=Dendrobium chrysotoxum TaxID=161865 RepID=A0AAV7GIV6_DENCH|nr:hypothetical protein IEQ34_015464 [Dendrobium chrysotoxum]